MKQWNCILWRATGRFTILKGFFIYGLLVLAGCQNDARIKTTYEYNKPDYDQVGLQVTQDTLHFLLGDNFYNDIRSVNLFMQDNEEFISLYDRRSESVCIYRFDSQKLVKKIKLKKIFKKSQLYKTCVYTKKFDSVFIANKESLYLIDRSGVIKNTIELIDSKRIDFENTNPAVISGSKLFVGVHMSARETSLSDIKKWKVLYEFDLQKNEARLHYNLPDFYHREFYGDRFLEHSYCVNRDGNFIFSFSADSMIYETNLLGSQTAYNARSRFQTDDIKPVAKEYLLNDEGSKQYAIRDSYGPIFYDAFRHRYLRMAKQKISEEGYESKKRNRKQSVIIFNEVFKIIGEVEIDNDFYFPSLFFSSNGSMFAQVNAKDEYALHFIRLRYHEKEEIPVPQLTINKSTSH